MDNISSVNRQASRAEILGLEANYQESEQKRGIPMGEAVPEAEFSAAKLRPVSKEASPEPEPKSAEPEAKEQLKTEEPEAVDETPKETAKEKAKRIKDEEAAKIKKENEEKAKKKKKAISFEPAIPEREEYSGEAPPTWKGEIIELPDAKLKQAATRRLSRVEFPNASSVASNLKLTGLRRPSVADQLLLEKKDDVEAKQKILKLEQNQRQIHRADMQLIRGDIKDLMQVEMASYRDGNARDKLTYSLMVESMKLIDLWEQGCHAMEVIDEKNMEIKDVKITLKQKITEREGLEHDNEVLRNEIAELRANLAAEQAANAQKDADVKATMKTIAGKKFVAKNLATKIMGVKKSQELLAKTMGDATSALGEAFAGMEDLMPK